MKNFKKLAKNFKALANERRLKILNFLLKEKKLTVGEISNKINLSFRSTSKHLKVLEGVGFVEWKQVETSVYYSASSGLPAEVVKLIKLAD